MFDKLDAYNLVANLVPGAALAYALSSSSFPMPDPANVVAFLLVAFVLGVGANRLGSLLLDPFLRWSAVSFLHKKDYKAFVTSERKDSKFETLVANSGLYRTFFTVGLLYFLLLGVDFLRSLAGLSGEFLFYVGVIAGMIIFLFAFKKEDDYINQRIASKQSQSED